MSSPLSWISKTNYKSFYYLKCIILSIYKNCFANQVQPTEENQKVYSESVSFSPQDSSLQTWKWSCHTAWCNYFILARYGLHHSCLYYILVWSWVLMSYLVWFNKLFWKSKNVQNPPPQKFDVICLVILKI